MALKKLLRFFFAVSHLQDQKGFTCPSLTCNFHLTISQSIFILIFMKLPLYGSQFYVFYVGFGYVENIKKEAVENLPKKVFSKTCAMYT